MPSGKPSANAIKAGEAFVELSADDAGFVRGLERIKNRLSRMGGLLRNTGLATAAAGAALLAPLVGSFTAAIKHADRMQDIADRTDSTSEAVSRLAYAADLSASSIEDVELGNKTLVKSAVAAQRGSKGQAAAFEQMGVSAGEFLEMPMDERFVLLAKTLEELDDPLERSTFLLNTLGKSASTLLPLLSGGADGLKALFDEAERSGQVVNSDDAKRSAAAMDLIDKAMKEVKATIFEIGLAFLGFGDDLKQSGDILATYLRQIREWVKNNKEVVRIVAIVAAVLIGAGLAAIVFGLAASGVSAIVSVLSGALTVLIGLFTVIKVVMLAIASPIGLIAALIVGLVVVILQATGLLDRFIGGVKNTFSGLGKMWSETFGGIVKAIQAGKLEMAWNLVIGGLESTYLTFLKNFKNNWFNFAGYFINTIAFAIAYVRMLFVKLWAWLRTALVDVLETVAKPVAEVTDFLNITDGKAKQIERIAKTARDNIKKDAEEDILKVDKEEQARLDKRNAEHMKEMRDLQQRINLIEAARKHILDMLNAPEIVDVGGGGLPVAPMPRRKRAGLVDQLGDSVQGLFQSADFRGVLGLGGPNTMAQKNLDKLEDIDVTLREIRDKIEINQFT